MEGAVESFDCRLCGAAVWQRAWGGAECPHCGSVSMKTLPSHEEISEFYATYNVNYSGGGKSQGENLRRYAQRYLQLVQRFAAGSGRLIDIGSSTNPFPNVAARRGYDTTMMDFVRPAGLSPQVKFIAGSINEAEAVEVGESSFDVVTCWAVLEHLPDPQLSARVLAGLCRPGGTILLSTPEIGTALTRYALGRSPWFYPPEHLCLVSPAAVGLLFESLDCTLVVHGRLELSPLRYVARYGIGAAEAALGLTAKMLMNRQWQRLRNSRVQSFQGVSYFVVKKRG